MRTEQYFRQMIEHNPGASIGFTLAAAMVYAARFGFCEAEQRATDEWKEIARRLKSDYGENLSADEVTSEMDAAHRSAAAAALGSVGGSSTSPAKRAASAANGKAPVRPGSRPRGRPRKS